MQTEAGLVLRLGDVSFAAGSDNAQVTTEDIANYGGGPVGIETIAAALSLVLLSCSSTPPKNVENACHIFAEKEDWYEAARETELDIDYVGGGWWTGYAAIGTKFRVGTSILAPSL